MQQLDPRDDNLIRLMLDPSIPRNQSQCKDCKLYQPSNAQSGSCKHRVVTLAKELTCYQAEV